MEKIKIRGSFLIAVLAIMINHLNAQISIILNKPMSYQVKVSDVFNGSLINSDNVSYKMYLVGTIINTKTGQKIVEAKTSVLEYATGTKPLNESILSPVYSYNSNVVKETGVLPYGNYELCLKAYAASDNEEKGASCVDEEVTPLTPPYLLSPENTSEISTPYPLLIWLPPTPVNNNIKVVFDLKLVELMPNQTAYDAIQRNFALLDVKDIPNTSMQYPSNAMPLEEGKMYAWQITAKTDQYMIGQTEVWTFRYASNKFIHEPTTEKNYVRLRKSMDNYYVAVQSQLKFIYEEPYVKTKVNARIYDLSKNEKGNLVFETNEVGDNKFSIELETINGLKINTFYMLEVSAAKRPNQYLLFKIIK